jgi:hypothetical protein
MFKLIGHVVIFFIGAGVGVYWGVHHPTQAANLADTETARIQQAVAAAKQQVLQQVVTEQSTANPDASKPGTPAANHLSKYQQMLQNAQSEFNSASLKLNGQ